MDSHTDQHLHIIAFNLSVGASSITSDHATLSSLV